MKAIILKKSLDNIDKEVEKKAEELLMRGMSVFVCSEEITSGETCEKLRMRGVGIIDLAIVKIDEYGEFDKSFGLDDWGLERLGITKPEIEETEPVESKEEKVEMKKPKYDIKGKKIADIVIPHHNRHDHLKDCLDRIPNDIFYIHVVSGGSFAENCNKGAKVAKTDNIIFLNDDTEPEVDVLKEMCEKSADIVGAAQIIPTNPSNPFYGISMFNEEGEFKPLLTDDKGSVDIPNGFMIRVKKKVFKDLKGFDEKFVNGGEDTDFGLRAIEMGKTIDYVYNPTLHKHSQSEGRLKYSKENQKLLMKKWPEKKVRELLDKKRVLIATNQLDRIGGTETWTYTMVKEFQRKGWNVDVFTTAKGIMSELLPTVDEPRKKYDLILINHTTCLEALEKVKGPKIFTSHGVFPAIEQPKEGADHYVAISDEVQEHMKEKGFKATIIRNGIDCDKFKPKKKIRVKPKKVLCMCQGEEALENVRKACEELKLDFEDTSTRKLGVEEKINDADIVFSLGRGAYEAMACGRAVIVYDSRPYSPFKTADGIITPKNAKKLAKTNFSGRANKYRWSVDDIKKEIGKYNQKMGEDNRKMAVTNFNIKRQADKYINLIK